MKNSLKYDPLSIHKTGDIRAAAINGLLSIKIETNLENKIKDLMKQLIDTDDEKIIQDISMEIQNIQADIEDLKKSRDSDIRRSRESSNV